MPSLSARIYMLLVALLVVMLLIPATALAAPSNAPSAAVCGQFYRVHFGDTLIRIALRFGTTASRLMALNGIANANRIFPGENLCVRSGVSTLPGFFYQVIRGDTLNRVGAHFGWSASFLASVNRLPNLNRIFVGQVLFVPRHS